MKRVLLRLLIAAGLNARPIATVRCGCNDTNRCGWGTIGGWITH